MRAIYNPLVSNIVDGEASFTIDGESHHHLVNVVRSKPGEELLLLDGKGGLFYFVIETILKNKTVLKKIEFEQKRDDRFIDIAVGVPKKDAFDSILKIAVECGVRRIYPLKSKYSQPFDFKKDRISNVVVSAMEQSNNPYMIGINECLALNELDFTIYDQVLVFFTEDDLNKPHQFSLQNTSKVLLVIGPEGGWDEEEINFFKSVKSILSIHVPIPIMRAPTALNFALGFTWKAKCDIL